MKRLSLRYSVRSRLLLLAIGVELVMLTLLVANSLRLLHGAMTEQTRWQVQQMMPVMNAALTAPLAQRDFATVQAVVDESRATEGIVYVVVTDRQGHTVASSGWPPGQPLPAASGALPLLSFSTVQRYDAVAPIQQSGQTMGTLHLGLDLTRIAIARRTLLTQGVGIAVAELILSSLILVLIGYWLTRHLTSLTEASLQVASGNLPSAPLHEGEDDVGQLGVAFNTMSRAIAERMNELTRAKEAAEASERAKSESEERLKLVLDGSNDGIWDWNARSGLLSINQRWAEMLGYTIEEIKPDVSAWEELVHPEDMPAVQQALNAHLSGQTPYYETEHRLRTKSGEWKWVLDRGKVVERDADGTPVRVAGTHTDITYRKRTDELLHEKAVMLEQEIAERQQAQELLAHKQKQLELLNQSLQERVDAAVAELRAKDQVLISQSRQAAMGEMIGNIAHQWRQPLNALSMLIANLQFARRDNDLSEEYMNEAAATANRLIQKMSTTINDFRNFFRPEKEMENFSALQQVDQAVQLVGAAFNSSNITLSIDAGEDCILQGFPNEYSQVLLNLFINAKEAIVATGATPGSIVVTVSAADGMGVVKVSDNGGGIPDDVIGKIFEPYFSTKNMGTGIGLYMSKMIIERNMNGTITVCNRGQGCEFTVITPLAEAHP